MNKNSANATRHGFRQQGRALWVAIGVVLFWIVVAGGLYFTQHIWRGFFSQEGSIYSDTKPLEIEWTDLYVDKRLRMQIPAAYITRVYSDYSGESEAAHGAKNGGIEIVSMEFYLPDLKPRASNQTRPVGPDSPLYEKFKEENARRVSVDLTAGGPSVVNRAEIRQRWFDGVLSSIKSKSSYQLPDLYGLERYREMACGFAPQRPEVKRNPPTSSAPEGCWDTPSNEVFISRNEFVGGYYSCAFGDNPQLGCHGYDLYDGWSISYGFRKSQLANWREIDSAVRKLLDSFRQDGRVEKTN